MSWPSGPKRMIQPYKSKITFNRVSWPHGSQQTSEIPKESQQGNLKSKGKKLKRNEEKNPKEIEWATVAKERDIKQWKVKLELLTLESRNNQHNRTFFCWLNDNFTLRYFKDIFFLQSITIYWSKNKWNCQRWNVQISITTPLPLKGPSIFLRIERPAVNRHVKSSPRWAC